MVNPTPYHRSAPAGTRQLACGRALTPATPVALGTDWLFLGDSETSGRANEASAVSQVDAFENIWNQTHASSIVADTNGVGGRQIASTHAAYLGETSIGSVTFINFQDSGGQDATIDEPAEYVALLEDFIDDVQVNSPNAVLTIETAYSFEEASDSGRYWPLHNDAMRTSINAYRGGGMEIYIAEVDRNITELVVQKRAQLGATAGQEAVFGDTGMVLGNHFTGLGNLMVALSIFEALNYDLTTLDLSAIPDGEISASDKALCISIIQGFA